jgi:hypothetical protein
MVVMKMMMMITIDRWMKRIETEILESVQGNTGKSEGCAQKYTIGRYRKIHREV